MTAIQFEDRPCRSAVAHRRARATSGDQDQRPGVRDASASGAGAAATARSSPGSTTECSRDIGHHPRRCRIPQQQAVLEGVMTLRNDANPGGKRARRRRRSMARRRVAVDSTTSAIRRNRGAARTASLAAFGQISTDFRPGATRRPGLPPNQVPFSEKHASSRPGAKTMTSLNCPMSRPS